MSGAAVFAIVMFLFFLVGVAVGVVLVASLSARRAEKVKVPRRIDPPLKAWPLDPETGPDDDEPDEPPWWRSRSS